MFSKENKKIVSSAVKIGVFIFVAKAISAVKEIAIAWKYGTSYIVDAFQIASSIMLLVPNVIVSAMMIVLVPVFIKSTNEKNGYLHALAEYQGAAISIGVILGVAFLPILSLWLGHIESDVRTLQTANEFAIAMIPIGIMLMLIGINTARLIANHVQIGSLFEAIPAGCILILVMIWPVDGKTYPILLGVLLGYAVQLYLTRKIADDLYGSKSKINFRFTSDEWKDLSKQLGLLFFGQVILAFVAPIDTATAALLGEGAVAQLGYSERLLSLGISFGALAIARGLLPVFSECSEKKDTIKLKELTKSWVLLSLFGGGAIAIVCAISSELMVRTVFERGAFGASDTIEVASVFRWGCARIPFYFAGLVLFQLVATQKKYLSIVVVNGVCLAIKWPLNEISVNYLGVSGVNLATTLMYCISFVGLGIAAIKSKKVV